MREEPGGSRHPEGMADRQTVPPREESQSWSVNPLKILKCKGGASNTVIGVPDWNG